MNINGQDVTAAQILAMALNPRAPVQSSQIKSIGHDGKNSMHVEFTDGSVYHYDNVTAEDHNRLMNAESIGSHFIKHIKRNPAAYPYRKL